MNGRHPRAVQRIARSAWLCIAAAMSLCAGAALAADLETDELIEAGSELYAEFCSECHGDDVAGLVNFSDSLTEFEARLSGETENMPDFSDFFSAGEIAALHVFLETMAAENAVAGAEVME